jgi:hypothetical protein
MFISFGFGFREITFLITLIYTYVKINRNVSILKLFINLVWHWHECAKPNCAPCQWRPWHVPCLPYPRYATVLTLLCRMMLNNRYSGLGVIKQSIINPAYVTFESNISRLYAYDWIRLQWVCLPECHKYWDCQLLLPNSADCKHKFRTYLMLYLHTIQYG